MQTIPWNFAKLVKNNQGIIVHQRLFDLRRIVLLRQQYAESRKELLQYCCNQAWTKNGGLNSKNATTICEMYKTSDRTGNTLLTAIWRTISRTKNSVLFIDRISSLFCHSLVKTPPIWQETSANNLPRFLDYAKGIWKGDILVSDTEELENLDA